MVAKSFFLRLALLGALAVVTHGCATAPSESQDAKVEADQVDDPFELPNRFIFAFNRAVDAVALRPAAVFYRDLVPPPVQRGTHNVLSNLDEPVTAFNELFQGDPERAGTTLARFVINSTVGILGLFDVARTVGLSSTKEDFGQTLGVWTKDYEGGPYLMLPLLGPSNPRDAVGLVVDYFTDPFGYVFQHYNVDYLSYVRMGADAVDSRARTISVLDDLERNSLDYYAAIRSAYRQRREAEIKNENYGKRTVSKPVALVPEPDREGDIAFAR